MTQITESVGASDFSWIAQDGSTGVSNGTGVPGGAESSSVTKPINETEARRGADTFSPFFLIWLTGVLVMLGYLVWQYIALHRRLREAVREAVREAGLETSVGVPLNRENVGQIDAFLDTLGTENLRLFVPHAEGRGALLEPIRLRTEDLSEMSGAARQFLNRSLYRSEAEWIASPPPEPTERSLLLSLTPENIGSFEEGRFEEILSRAEALDEAYYAPIPLVEELMRLYGDPEGDAFFSARDLAARWQKRWLREQGLHPYDVTDERQTGSRRF